MTGISLESARAPEGVRLYAIGDVHGRFDLLEEMHRQIEDDLARDCPPDWRLIHLGDYVDRGPQSREVIDLLARRTASDPRVLALLGNHDQGLLDYLHAPETEHLFARFGGETTARSYGVEADFLSPETRRQTRDALLAAMPNSHVDFLESRPRAIAFGDFFFCHAGIRPNVALDRQDPSDLIWIRRDFLDHVGLHPKVVVHGHTPASSVEIRPNRVNLDTGAYRTGILSALAIDGREKRILEVRDRPA